MTICDVTSCKENEDFRCCLGTLQITMDGRCLETLSKLELAELKKRINKIRSKNDLRRKI